LFEKSASIQPRASLPKFREIRGCSAKGHLQSDCSRLEQLTVVELQPEVRYKAEQREQ